MGGAEWVKVHKSCIGLGKSSSHVLPQVLCDEMRQSVYLIPLVKIYVLSGSNRSELSREAEDN